MALWLLLVAAAASNFYFWHAGKLSGAESMRDSIMSHPSMRGRKEANRLAESA